jgi:GxxExxY protein
VRLGVRASVALRATRSRETLGHRTYLINPKSGTASTRRLHRRSGRSECCGSTKREPSGLLFKSRRGDTTTSQETRRSGGVPVIQEALLVSRCENLRVDSECRVPLDYKGQRISSGLKLDLLVDGCVVVELKAVECLHPIHLAHVITYLKLTGCPAGLLMNFNSTTLKAGLRRLTHPDLYVKKTS